MNKHQIKFIIFLSCLILCELAVTVGIYYALSIKNNDSLKDLMITINKNIINEVNQVVNSCKFQLAKNSVFLRIHGIYISKDDYLDFLQLNYSVINDSVQYYLQTIKLTNDNLEEYQEFCRENIISNCMISQFYNNSIIQVVNKSYYWPLIFFNNATDFIEDFIGYDLSTSNSSTEFINKTIETTEFTSWSRTDLAMQTANPYNYGVTLSKISLYDPNGTNNIDNVIGIDTMIIKVGTLFYRSAQKSNASVNINYLDIFVFDVSNNTTYNQSLLYKRNIPRYSHIWHIDDMPSSFSIFEYNFAFANKNWKVYFSYSDKFLKENSNTEIIIVPIVVAIILILIDIIMCGLYKLYIMFLHQLKINEQKNVIAMQMLGYVNHEVRNPLNVIKGLITYILEILKDHNTKKVRITNTNLSIIISDLSTVLGSCDLLEHIVTDILDIRKLESGKLDLDNKLVPLEHFMNDMKKTLSQKIDEKQTIKLIMDFEKNVTIFIDPYRLKQILLNYITNALKYTDSGSITIKIKKTDDSMRFSVIDTGRGIKNEDKHKIFKPFNQLSPEDASRYGGIGLGLHLCSMLATRMNGTVGFTSTYTEGSTFWVEFNNDVIDVKNSIPHTV